MRTEPGLRATLGRDVEAARERDPAARSTVEIVLAYPGLHAVWGHRIAHLLWVRGHRLAARLLAEAVHVATGVDIHPGAVIGAGLFIDHATGVVIGETAEVGDDVTLYQGVTLGGTSLEPGKRHPTIGHRVTIGAGAKVLGPVVVGDDSRIGANAVVVRDVPPDAVVVGVPGQVIARRRPRGRQPRGQCTPRRGGCRLRPRLPDGLPDGSGRRGPRLRHRRGGRPAPRRPGRGGRRASGSRRRGLTGGVG